MTAINQNVILKKISTTNSSGIIMNTVSNNKAEVISVSKEINILKTGDIVLFNPDKAINYTHDGVQYLVCNINDILLIF